jgi:hypothetical protein
VIEMFSKKVGKWFVDQSKPRVDETDSAKNRQIVVN